MIGWTQKGKVSRLIGHEADERSLITRPGIKHHPKVARNGCAEQSNPFDALQTIGAGNQPQAQTGEIAQEAKAPGKARGYADVGTDYRKVKVLADVRSYGRRANSY
jgi:hypothetical protein